jgi:hypothetical protein
MIDFGLCMIIAFGNKLKDFIPKLNNIVHGWKKHHAFLRYAEKYMKDHSTLVHFEDAFFDYEKNYLF